MNIKNKIILITGASSGIGRATALAFAEAGGIMALIARSKEALEDLAEEIRHSGGKAISMNADITDLSAHQRIIERVEKEWGHADILVNNAGIGLNAPVKDIDHSDLKRIFEVNFFGPFHLTRAVLPMMIARKQGMIINVLSISGRRAMPNQGGYCASKAALEMLMDSLRMELAGFGIKVVNIFPGFTLTPFGQNALGEKSKGRGKKLAVAPELVAKAVLIAVQQERRDTYATWKDRLAVAGVRLFPSLADRAMERVWGLKKTT